MTSTYRGARHGFDPITRIRYWVDENGREWCGDSDGAYTTGIIQLQPTLREKLDELRDRINISENSRSYVTERVGKLTWTHEYP